MCINNSEPSFLQGFPDLPESKDSLGMDLRCKGIAEFISECSTPMTLAIQGDWGTGKTSCMKIIGKFLKDKLQEKLCLIEFNTWQFSVLGSDEKIIFDLLQTMIDQLDKWRRSLKISSPSLETDFKDTKKSLVNGIINGAAFLTKELFSDTIPGKIVSSVASAANKDPEKLLENLLGAPATRTQTILEMKDKINNLINEILDNNKTGDRIFIFVDDLDRLEPRIAVELMEGLKNFADCDRCVFILAIDQTVVERGLQAKFGKDFDKDKAKKFFDKIIQIPFSLPVGDYDIRSYIASLSNSRNVDTYVSILHGFNEKNPRTIKRSFNSLKMNECTELARNPQNAITPRKDCQLYSVLLLQLESANDFIWLSDTVDQFWNSNEPDKVNYEEFYSALTSHITPSDDPDSDDTSPLSQQFLSTVYEQFFCTSVPYSKASHEEGLRQLALILRQSRETSTISEEITKPMQVIRTMKSIISRLKDSGMVFADNLDSTITAQSDRDIAEKSEKIVLRGSQSGKTISLSLNPGGKAMNLTIYTDIALEEIISGVEDDVYEPNGSIPPAESTYGYYYHPGKRITISNFSFYNKNGTLDTMMRNCGISLK